MTCTSGLQDARFAFLGSSVSVWFRPGAANTSVSPCGILKGEGPTPKGLGLASSLLSPTGSLPARDPCSLDPQESTEAGDLGPSLCTPPAEVGSWLLREHAPSSPVPGPSWPLGERKGRGAWEGGRSSSLRRVSKQGAHLQGQQAGSGPFPECSPPPRPFPPVHTLPG